MARWKELSEGKTSNDLVDVLLTEMASGEVVDTGGAEYFDGQVTVTECWNERLLMFGHWHFISVKGWNLEMYFNFIICWREIKVLYYQLKLTV